MGSTESVEIQKEKPRKRLKVLRSNRTYNLDISEAAARHCFVLYSKYANIFVFRESCFKTKGTRLCRNVHKIYDGDFFINCDTTKMFSLFSSRVTVYCLINNEALTSIDMGLVVCECAVVARKDKALGV